MVHLVPAKGKGKGKGSSNKGAGKGAGLSPSSGEPGESKALPLVREHGRHDRNEVAIPIVHPRRSAMFSDKWQGFGFASRACARGGASSLASALGARTLALSFAFGRDEVDHMTLLCSLLLQPPQLR